MSDAPEPTAELTDSTAPAEPTASVSYRSYLALDEVLGAQRPRSEEHDEVLFIVIHQVYELWFKQLLHESARAQRKLEAHNAPQAMHTMRRMRAILKTIVSQLDVLETLTPVQYSGFRGRLDAASGFQSAQFRELEAAFGRRDRGVLGHYCTDSDEHTRIAAAIARPGLFDSFLAYLDGDGWQVPAESLHRDLTAPLTPSPELQDVLAEVYARDGDAAQVCEGLVDLDEGLQEWRYRHVMMVQRTIGDKVGTGGSSGAAYLRETLFKPAFPDLWAVRGRL
ncbi:MAG: tryptophan 2,3-dioxygenase [Solirubrobacteraceae bacterium]